MIITGREPWLDPWKRRYLLERFPLSVEGLRTTTLQKCEAVPRRARI